MFSLAMASSSSAVTPSPFAIASVIGADAIPEASLDPDPATLPINEIELERERLHNERLKYLPVALNLLKADYPDLYRLIVEYYYAETKTTMADLGKRHGLTTETVRYRIKSAKEKLKLYIIMHENKE